MQLKEVESISHLVVSDFLGPHGLQPTRILCPWNSPGKNTRVGSHSLLQGIFLTQELNPCLLHCRQILYCLSHQGSTIQCWQSIYSFFPILFGIEISCMAHKQCSLMAIVCLMDTFTFQKCHFCFKIFENIYLGLLGVC